MKNNKIMRCYRINPMILEEMQKVLEELKIKETSFIEMAIIEKIARIQAKEEKTNNTPTEG